MGKNYKWTLTARKFFIILIEIFAAGGISYFTGIPELIGLVPVFEAVRNFIKHYGR